MEKGGILAVYEAASDLKSYGGCGTMDILHTHICYQLSVNTVIVQNIITVSAMRYFTADVGIFDSTHPTSAICKHSSD